MVGPPGLWNETVFSAQKTPQQIRAMIDLGWQFTSLRGSNLLASGAPIPQSAERSAAFRPPTGILMPDLQGDIREIITGWIGGWFGPGQETAPQEFPPLPPLPPGGPFLVPGMNGLPRGATPYINLPDGTRGCPSGYHPEKSGRGYCVRNRRMNALNPRALSRASRRVGGFARAVKRARTLKRICRSL